MPLPGTYLPFGAPRIKFLSCYVILVALCTPAARSQLDDGQFSNCTAGPASSAGCQSSSVPTGNIVDPPSTGPSTVEICVVGNAAPFVSHTPVSGVTLQAIIQEESLSYEDFMDQFKGHDVDMIAALVAMKFPDAKVMVHVKATYPGALYAIRTGQCDFGATAFTRTEYRGQCRECPYPGDSERITNEFACCLNFTDPYFTDGMTVLTRYGTKNAARSLGNRFWTPSMVQAICVLVLFLIVSGHLVWFFERKLNKAQFQDSYLDGVDNGIWWSIVTMTTVGYGDKVPITIPGRIIACVWMITGVLLFGVFNGAVVSVMQMPEERVNLSGPYDSRLERMSMCATRGASGAFISSFGLTPSVRGDSMLECFQFLLEGKVDSVFYDRLPMLEAADPRVETAATSLLQKVSPGVEVGKSFQMAHFSAAMPSKGGRYNAEVEDGIARLNAGEVVFSPRPGMSFGFSMVDNRQRWTDFNEVLYTTRQMEGQVSASSWETTYKWLSVTVCITVLYILVQFGGLWIRRYRRFQAMKKSKSDAGKLTLCMLPLKDENDCERANPAGNRNGYCNGNGNGKYQNDGSSDGAGTSDDSAEKALGKSGLKNGATSLEAKYSMIPRGTPSMSIGTAYRPQAPRHLPPSRANSIG